MSIQPRRATRSDVARAAGTSVAVVSYVINDGPRNVSAERKARVLEAMRALNYQPNAIARSLTTTQTNTIGLIVPNISNGFFAEIALAVEEEALKEGKLLFIGNANEERAREDAYADSFLRQRVDGVLVIGVAQNASLQKFAMAGIPTVVLDRAQDVEGLITVGIDNRAAAREATRHLISHGHRRISCVTGLDGLPVADERLEGWRDAMAAAGLAAPDADVARATFSLEGGADAFEALRARGGLAPALFVASDEQARGLCSAAGAAGYAIPADLAIVSVDGTRTAAFANPPLTTMRQPMSELARAAVRALIHGEAPQSRFEATLRLGRSSGCRD
jgi:LacI family transcriptional regulator